MAVPDLPDDILHLVIDQLRSTHDFHTLFNSALASKRLAVPALSALYRYSSDSLHSFAPDVFAHYPATRVRIPQGNRLVGRYVDRFVSLHMSKPPMYEVAPVTERGRDESVQIKASPSQLAARWAGMWRSIVLSCVGLTAFPYCSYLRVLDLGDLGYLFDDGQFTGKTMKAFFEDLSLAVGKTGPTGGVKRGWNQKQSVQRIGDLITQKSSLVEELDGNLDGDILSTWIPRLKKLTRLRLWNGHAVANCGGLIAEGCPNFKAVEFYAWNDPGKVGLKADEEFAGFLSSLQNETLERLEVMGSARFGPLTFSALSARHGNTLTELILNDIPPEAVPELGELKGCTALRTLQISEPTATTNLESTHPGVIEEVVSWLKECKELTSIKFGRFQSGAAILTPLFSDPTVGSKLVVLELTGFAQSSAIPFYNALPTQAESLKDLTLQSETEEDPMRIEALVSAICSLRRLSSLDIKSISDFFRDEHYIVIASSLRQLEELWLSGWGVTDAIFDALAGLHSLKRVELYAVSQFTCEGLLNYIAQLGDDNRELLLGVSMAAPYAPLSEQEQEIVRQTLQEKVNGRFDYALARDPDADDDDSDEDSD